MSIEQSKEVIRRFFQSMHSGAFEPDLFAENYVNYGFGRPMPFEEAKGVLDMFLKGFPDMDVTIDDMVAEGDTVAARFTMRGTHSGEFQGIPATGKAVTVTGMGMWRIADGRLVEDRNILDNMAMMQQLGLVPSQEATV